MSDSVTHSASLSEPLRASRWRPEWEVVALVLLVALVYFSRPFALPIFGEEPRRGVIAREMLETGDWIAPRVQGILRVSRPPLQNWMIAAGSVFSGRVDALAVRLPSFLATLATVLLVYLVGRGFLSRIAATSAAVAYCTMHEVLQFGRLGETEAVFTVFVASSLLLWWHGRHSGWNPKLVWSIAFACTAMGTLTKGLQAPVYFVGITGSYLLLSGKWRELFGAAYWIGAVVGVSLVAAWQIPFTLETSLSDSWQIYFWNVANRFGERYWLPVIGHWISYPLEVLFGSLAPWSLLLAPLASRRFRATLGALTPHTQFLALCCLFALVFVWFPPGSRTRYYMPLYPCYALLVGVVMERLTADGDAAAEWYWLAFRNLVTVVAAICGVAILAVSLAWPNALAALPWSWALAYGTLCTVVVVVMLRSGHWAAERSLQAGVWAAALFLGVTYAGPWLTVQGRRCEDVAASVAALREELPPGSRLVSFGQLMHTFLFYYPETIDRFELPETLAEVPADLEYFSIHTYKTEPPELPFAWEQIAVVSCDRFQRPVPQDRIYVGRRIAPTTASTDEPQRR